ncbi:hypothetical protein [Streptomyces gardneri]|uniref:hypothetical protein n=1 Tax=Streptomyces gardneri TaxID=66892 RepID=UPI0033FBF017
MAMAHDLAEIGLRWRPTAEIRLHDTTLHASLFLHDENLLVNPHVWACPASVNPLLHLRQGTEGAWFEPTLTASTPSGPASASMVV